MVASGVADRMVILSPRVWKTQAAEHDPADAEHLRDLIAHELVHVYHGQHNPRPDFDGMDDSGWFVEGLAVYVSGQLERSHRGQGSGPSGRRLVRTLSLRRVRIDGRVRGSALRPGGRQATARGRH